MAHSKHKCYVGIWTNFNPFGVKFLSYFRVLRIDRDKFYSRFCIFFKVRIVSAICYHVINLVAFKQIGTPHHINFRVFKHYFMCGLQRINFQISNDSRVYSTRSAVTILTVGSYCSAKNGIKKSTCYGVAVVKKTGMPPAAIACIINFIRLYALKFFDY